MLEDILRELKDAYGVFYIRMLRKNAVGIYEPGTKFPIGKGITLRDGKDVTLIASGIMVHEALKAADMLEADGVSARVVNIFTWKPLDEELLLLCAAETGAMVTCENHNIVGGLGSAVAEVLIKNNPIPVEMVGVKDTFGEVGSEKYLRERFNLNDTDIAAAAKKAVGRK
jgi:transketolase